MKKIFLSLMAIFLLINLNNKNEVRQEQIEYAMMDLDSMVKDQSVVRSFVLPSELEQTIYQPATLSDEDLQCLAKNIYFEARGEPLTGKYAVAHVTLNRVESDKFPDTICDVVYQRWKRTCQFSWVCKPHSIREPKAYEEALDIAKKVYYNEIKDVTNGAQFFHAYYVRPRWSRVFKKTLKVGNHTFYKDI